MATSDTTGGGERNPLLAIAEATAMSVGNEFLEALISSMHRNMNVDLALIATAEGSPPSRARALYAVEGNKPARAADFVYDLKGTPCEIVIAGNRLVVPCDFADRFPEWSEYDSYIGVPLLNSEGLIAGHLAVFSVGPIAEPAGAESIVRLFGLRAEAELRRIETEREQTRMLDEQRTLSGRLAKRYRKVHEANAYKTRLMAMIAHDLRSPLAALMSRAEFIGQLLDRGPDESDKVKASCEDIVEGAERMARLIGSILDQAREETDRLVVTRGVVKLETAVTVAVDANRDAADVKAIGLEIDIPEPILVEGDEDLLIQAVDNLIANAIKYSHSDTSVRITAALDDGAVVLRIRDQGLGLTEEDLSRAFGEFATLSARPTGGEASLGLGLATVRRIIEAHEGKITVASEGRDRGATFTIRLPALPGASVD
jgi:signal transduction histidine kinase